MSSSNEPPSLVSPEEYYLKNSSPSLMLPSSRGKGAQDRWGGVTSNGARLPNSSRGPSTLRKAETLGEPTKHSRENGHFARTRSDDRLPQEKRGGLLEVPKVVVHRVQPGESSEHGSKKSRKSKKHKKEKKEKKEKKSKKEKASRHSSASTADLYNRQSLATTPTSLSTTRSPPDFSRHSLSSSFLDHGSEPSRFSSSTMLRDSSSRESSCAPKASLLSNMTPSEIRKLDDDTLGAAINELETLRSDDASFFEAQLDCLMSEFVNCMVSKNKLERDFLHLQRGKGFSSRSGRTNSRVLKEWYQVSVTNMLPGNLSKESNEDTTPSAASPINGALPSFASGSSTTQSREVPDKIDEEEDSYSGLYPRWLVCGGHVLALFDDPNMERVSHCLPLEADVRLSRNPKSRGVILEHDILSVRWEVVSDTDTSYHALWDHLNQGILFEDIKPAGSLLPYVRNALLDMKKLHKEIKSLDFATNADLEQATRLAQLSVDISQRSINDLVEACLMEHSLS